MTELQWIVPIIGILFIAFSIFLFLFRLQRKKQVQVIMSIITQELTDCPCTYFSNTHTISCITDKYEYSFKMVFMPSGSELIITNETYWCINTNLSGWKRSTKPDLVDGVTTFLAKKPSMQKPMKRIAVLTPSAHNITRYLNESDVEIVKPGDIAYGVYFLRVQDLAVFLAKLERK
jgi:hypothetical protein